MQLCSMSSNSTEPTQSNIKRNVDYNHVLTPIQCDVPIYMQCNAPLHVISCHMYNECYMDNTNHTAHLLSWTITSLAYDFHTSCTHIPTSTYNMSFYFQAMTHTRSSHVMTICTYKLITCQYIRTHILTSKHVTHSQVMTLSNKSYNGLEVSHNNHKPG